VHLYDGAPPKWTAEVNLTLEAGQLEHLASEARTFEQSAPRAS
jgi:hypothetical protein